MAYGYRLLVYKKDRRCKDGWKLVELKDYPGFSSSAMAEEISGLQRTQYPVPKFYLDFEPMTRMVKNLMTGEMVEIDYRTPYCADPSSESYWSA